MMGVACFYGTPFNARLLYFDFYDVYITDALQAKVKHQRHS